MQVRWDEDKDRVLLVERGLCFQDVVEALLAGDVFDDYPHPNQSRYPGQRILAVKIRGYACLVPYVLEGEGRFLKTIIPSRKAHKKFKDER